MDYARIVIEGCGLIVVICRCVGRFTQRVASNEARFHGSNDLFRALYALSARS
ncbi:hypothetical protein [Roseiflexus sp.]